MYVSDQLKSKVEALTGFQRRNRLTTAFRQDRAALSRMEAPWMNPHGTTFDAATAELAEQNGFLCGRG